ncbi:hypothetical protein K492DRAFT_219281 [Lichtheimia hyalospora FSU 10163]|nr:hypothetical protein K492DRAFT_219281 [Lichtheimia hyalospora FSU 10163]
MVSSPSSPTLNGHNSDSASVHSTNRERQKSTDTSDNDDDTPLQQGTQRFSSWSNASTGKSSGSFSLYSTFGPEASDSTLDLDQQPLPELPIGHRSPSPPSSAHKKEETTTTSPETNQADDDEDDSDSDDDDLFVDATGMSQEDMEREKRTSSSSSKKRLSKRLSGGHFGSAGGLMLSTAANRNSTQELAELMMNWRRESIDISLPAAATLSNRPPSISRNNPPSLTLSSAFTSSALPDPPPPNQPSSALPLPPQSSASAPTMTTQSMDKETAHEGEARFAAQHIWQDDESFIVKERAAEWLGQGKPLNGKALVYYMDYFDFSDMRMDTAFRKLCSKLYFKAEAQQIDRILQVFAQRYWKYIVYAVAYSLLLLNTDLHVAQGNHTRMNRVAFVRNTMSTIQDHNDQKRSSSILGGGSRRVVDFKRSVNSMVRKSGRESTLFSDDIVINPMTSPLSSPKPQPPYYKEGVVIRKHLLETSGQKSKHREWKECFVVVGHGELKMYASQGSNGTLAESLSHRSSIMAGTSTMQLLGTIKLNHSLANVLPPPGYNRQRPHVFAVQQPHGGVYLFQAPSHEQVNEWVATCNYWAARQSKEPLAGGVSNMEYGWGSCLDDWKPPMPPSVSSTLDELDQLDALRKHLGTLSNDINEHRDLKRKMLIKFSTKTQNHTKVMSNWESKSTYLLHEIIKYQNYCDALEKCIKQHQQEQVVEEVVAPHEYRQSIAMAPSLPMHLEYEESEMDLFSEIGKELAQLSTTTSHNKG